MHHLGIAVELDEEVRIVRGEATQGEPLRLEEDVHRVMLPQLGTVAALAASSQLPAGWIASATLEALAAKRTIGGSMAPEGLPNGEPASANITERIQELGDWRGETLAQVRRLIHEADPDVVEEWKWQKASSPGTPVWSHDGGICTGETYKQVVKLTFFRGASIEDPKTLFNSSLEGSTRRAIDLREGERIDEAAFKQLFRAAVAANAAARAQRGAKSK